MAVRVSQVSARVLSNGAPAVRVAQVSARVLSNGAPAVRVAQVSIRVLSENVADGPTPVSRRRRQMYVIG